MRTQTTVSVVWGRSLLRGGADTDAFEFDLDLIDLTGEGDDDTNDIDALLAGWDPAVVPAAPAAVPAVPAAAVVIPSTRLAFMSCLETQGMTAAENFVQHLPSEDQEQAMVMLGARAQWLFAVGCLCACTRVVRG